jgi:hypothetical protein
LQRFICIIAGQLAEMQVPEGDIALDRTGSHTEENFIGKIRSICHGDNRFDTVRHRAVWFEYARARLSILGVERKSAKRVNLGWWCDGISRVSDLKALPRLLLPSC